MANPDAGVVFISKVGKDVHQLGEILRSGNTLLVSVHEPFAELLVMITGLNDYLTKAIDFTGYVDKFLAALKKAFQLCKYLGDLIPEVGPFLADVAAFIEKLNLEDKIARILHEIRSIIKKAQDGIMSKVKSAATTICKRLEELLNHLPSWIDTAHIIEVSMQLIAFLLPLSGLSTETIANTISDKLKALVCDAAIPFKPLVDILSSIKDFLERIWKPVKEAIVDPIVNGFKSVFRVLEPVFEVVKNCGIMCDTIEDWLAPFFWVMRAVEWIFEHTVGWLIDKIKDGFHLEDFINGLIKKLEDSLGITAAKQKLEEIFGSQLEEIGKHLHTFTEGFDLGGVYAAMMNLTSQLQTFQKHPMDSAMMLISLDTHGGVPRPPPPPHKDDINFQIVLPKRTIEQLSPRISKRRRITSPTTESLSLNKAKELESTPGSFLYSLLEQKSSIQKVFGVPEKEISDIEKRKKNMDDFVAQIFPGLNTTRPLNTHSLASSRVMTVPSDSKKLEKDPEEAFDPFLKSTIPDFQPSAAPMLSLASTPSGSISVIIRTRHQLILNGQAMAQTYALQDERPQVSIPEDSTWEETPKWTVHGVIKSLRLPQPEIPPGSIDGLLSGKKLSKSRDASDTGNGDAKEDNESISFNDYKKGVEDLTKVILDLQDYLTHLIPICKRADDDFANFTPDALEFTDHLMAMLDGLGPSFDTLIELLGLTQEYRALEEKAFRDLVANIGLPESFGKIINPFLDAFLKIRSAIDKLNKERQDLRGIAANTYEPYRMLSDHVSKICSPERFVRSLGPDITGLSAFVIALYGRLTAMHSSFICSRDMGQKLYDNLGPSADAQALLDRLGHVYGNLLAAVKKAAEDTSGFRKKLEELEGKLYPLHEDVRRFFEASQVLSTMCHTVEIQVLAADRVRAICARIHNAIGPFRELLGKPEVVTELQSSPTGETAFDAIGELFSDASFAAVYIILEHFLKFTELQTDIVKLQSNLKNDVTGEINEFDTKLKELVQLAEAKNVNLYSPQDSTLEVPVFSSLMDEKTSKEFNDILVHASTLSKPEDFQNGKAKTGKDLEIKIPKWSSSDVHENKITMEAIRRWGAEWDKAESGTTGQNFVKWYDLLDNLERLMKTREKWQRPDVSQARPELPTSVKLGSNESKLWEALESKAIEGASRYHTDIAAAIQKPIQDRLQQLISGPLPLNPAAPDDILKLLPLPQDSTTPPDYLRSQASLVVEKYFPTSQKGKIPEELADLLGCQIRLENIKHDLICRFLPLRNVSGLHMDADKAIETLEKLHNDYNCIAGRMLLELTGDSGAAMSFLKAAEDEAFLKSGWLDPMFTE